MGEEARYLYNEVIRSCGQLISISPNPPEFIENIHLFLEQLFGLRHFLKKNTNNCHP
ncbi:MAG: hypothetical protein LZF61_07895 [Nitrosomonas sp.]|nr:MAG: hypothetical protein LZF61_07895 [Nitrosomonas sp.]